MQYLKLRPCQWGLAGQNAIKTAKDFENRKLLPLETSLAQLRLRGTMANPGRNRAGEAALYATAFERLIGAVSADPALATADEVRQALAFLPELKRHSRIVQKGPKLTLEWKWTPKPWRKASWAQCDWALIFEKGGRHHLFEVSGRDLTTLLTVFSYLNGAHREADIKHAFRSKRALVTRFLEFCRRLKLLDSRARAWPQPQIRKRRSARAVELVAHSCLKVRDHSGWILIDPTIAGMDRVFGEVASLKGVFITHHHFDHMHVSAVARLPRHIPVFVPRPQRSERASPNLARYFKSLGFTDVRECAWWSTHSIGAIKVTIVPSYGECFAPGASFDAYTYLIELAGTRLYGSVDAYEDEHGSMDDVVRELKKRVGQVDVLFFGSSDERHRDPVFSALPFAYSNTAFGGKFRKGRKYVADFATIRRWLKALEVSRAVPYAEFIFENPPPKRPKWEGDLKRFSREIAAHGTRLVRLAPGEAL